MRSLAHWCIAHRRRVAVAKVAAAVLTTGLAHAVGPNYVASVGQGPGRSGRLIYSGGTSKTQSGDAKANSGRDPAR